MQKLIFSSAFQQQLKKLVVKNPKLKNKISKTLKLLIKNKNYPSLRLHKLSGKNNWSISATTDIRIIIHFDKNSIYCLRIGAHNQVY
jgi:mRNA-degrading endonuclease YafQ of YafQ-DinJ toxin-antitoxin module